MPLGHREFHRIAAFSRGGARSAESRGGGEAATGQVTGKILDENGKPLTGGQVWLYAGAKGVNVPKKVRVDDKHGDYAERYTIAGGTLTALYKLPKKLSKEYYATSIRRLSRKATKHEITVLLQKRSSAPATKQGKLDALNTMEFVALLCLEDPGFAHEAHVHWMRDMVQELNDETWTNISDGAFGGYLLLRVAATRTLLRQAIDGE